MRRFLPSLLASLVLAQAAAASAAVELDCARSPCSWLGIEAQDMTPDLAEALGTIESRGVLITAVAPRSPASRAGLRPGDLIIGLQAAPVDDVWVLADRLDVLAPGRAVTVQFVREGMTATRQIVPARPPSENTKPPADAPRGAPRPEAPTALRR